MSLSHKRNTHIQRVRGFSSRAWKTGYAFCAIISRVLPKKLDYDDLLAETTANGRLYTTPSGARYPSITTVLSILSEDGIRAWRQRVGEEAANRISTRAANRGTAVHSIVERYLNNEDINYSLEQPHIVQSLKNLKPICARCNSSMGDRYTIDEWNEAFEL